MRRGGHRNQGGSLAHVPDALDGIADHDVRRAWTGDEAVGRTGAVLGAVRRKGEHVHVGGLGAGPLVVEGQRGGVVDVELGRWLRQGNRQIVVVADARRADLFDARVRELAGHHGSEVPAGRRGRGDRAARGVAARPSRAANRTSARYELRAAVRNVFMGPSRRGELDQPGKLGTARSPENPPEVGCPAGEQAGGQHLLRLMRCRRSFWAWDGRNCCPPARRAKRWQRKWPRAGPGHARAEAASTLGRAIAGISRASVAPPQSIAALCDTSPEARLRHAYGRAYPDLVRGSLVTSRLRPTSSAFPGLKRTWHARWTPARRTTSR